MLGRSEQRLVDTHSDSHRKHWATEAELSTKSMRKAQLWFALLSMNTKQQQF
jgi:hypothetical protein